MKWAYFKHRFSYLFLFLNFIINVLSLPLFFSSDIIILYSWLSSILKLSIKIYPVTAAAQLDNNYYISNDPTYAVSGDKVVETITKSADRKLADEDAKDEEGNQLFELDGTTKIINYGKN